MKVKRKDLTAEQIKDICKAHIIDGCNGKCPLNFVMHNANACIPLAVACANELQDYWNEEIEV